MAKKIDHQSEDCNTAAVKEAACCKDNVEKAVRERNQPNGAKGKK